MHKSASVLCTLPTYHSCSCLYGMKNEKICWKPGFDLLFRSVFRCGVDLFISRCSAEYSHHVIYGSC